MKRLKEIFSSDKLSFTAGLLLLFFGVFSLWSSVSYLFTWKRDQDLLGVSNYFDATMRIANSAGTSGLTWGHFIVGNCIGMAAVLFGAAILFLAVKLFLGLEVDKKKAAIYLLVLPLVFSLLLSWIAIAVDNGMESIFDGGLGGGAGLFLMNAANCLVGKWLSLALVLLLLYAAFACLNENLIPAIRRKVRKSENSGNVSESEPESEPESVPAVSSGDFAEVTVPDDFFSVPKEENGEIAVQGASEYAGRSDVGLITPTAEDAGSAVASDEGSDSACAKDVSFEIDSPEEELSTDVEEELPQIDIRGEVGRYTMPSLDLLEDYADKRFTLPDEELKRNVEKIQASLAAFKIPVKSISASVGYTVTLYKITLGDGVRVNTVRNLEDDIAIQLCIKGVRIVMLADAVGIEVPNDRPSVVPLKAILNSEAFRNSKAELPIALGYTITTKAKVFDLADAPHLLVAGATKQGKSVGLNAVISSLLYSKHPTELKFVFVDPKMVEFQQYGRLLKHYLAVLPAGPDNPDQSDQDRAIVKYPKDAEEVLRSLCVEMDNRYKLMAAASVNKVTDYNEKYRNRHLLPTEGHYYMPYLVIVIDEYADLTKASFGTDKNISRSIENSINRLAAKGRAAGLHIIIATQRPSVDVITGTIKGNFPTRIAFRTASRQDSMTILGQPGADRLIGKGDMLYFTGADAERVQCALVSSDETERLTTFVAQQTGFRQSCSQPYYLPDPGNLDGTPSDGGEGRMIDMTHVDELFREAAQVAVMNGNISTSMLQRKMSLGFARAGKIMDQLESAGIVGPQCGSKPREVLVPDMKSLDEILQHFLK